METESEMPALAPGESWRSVGRRARGVSVGMGGADVEEGEELVDAEGLEPVGAGAGAAVGCAVGLSELGFSEGLLDGEDAADELADAGVDVPVELPPPLVELGLLACELLLSSSSPPSPFPLPKSMPTLAHAFTILPSASFSSLLLQFLATQLADFPSMFPVEQWHLKSVSEAQPSVVRVVM